MAPRRLRKSLSQRRLWNTASSRPRPRAAARRVARLGEVEGEGLVDDDMLVPPPGRPAPGARGCRSGTRSRRGRRPPRSRPRRGRRPPRRREFGLDPGGIARGDQPEIEPRDGADQGRVEGPAGIAVADQADADRGRRHRVAPSRMRAATEPDRASRRVGLTSAYDRGHRAMPSMLVSNAIEIVDVMTNTPVAPYSTRGEATAASLTTSAHALSHAFDGLVPGRAGPIPLCRPRPSAGPHGGVLPLVLPCGTWLSRPPPPGQNSY